MTETDARDALSAYLDGELSSEEAARVEALLAEDDALRTEFDGLKEVSEGLASLPSLEAPEGFLAAVHARVNAGESGEVEPDAEVVDFEAERRRIAALEAAADSERAPEKPSNVILGWWVKGPALAAAAALLVVGLGRLFIGPEPTPPAMMAAAPRASSAPTMAEAPAPTGTAPEPPAAPVGLGETTPEVAVGFAGSTMPPPSTPSPATSEARAKASPPARTRRSGIRVASGSRPPAGVYAADYEVAEGEPAAAADSGGPPSSEESGADESADVETEGPAAGSLVLSRADGMQVLDAAIRARGWNARYIGADGAVSFGDGVEAQTVEITARAGEADVRGLLAGQGRLRLGAMTPGADGMVRVRLTVTYAAE